MARRNPIIPHYVREAMDRVYYLTADGLLERKWQTSPRTGNPGSTGRFEIGDRVRFFMQWDRKMHEGEIVGGNLRGSVYSVQMARGKPVQVPVELLERVDRKNPHRRFMDDLMREKIRLGGLVVTRATAAVIMREIADSYTDRTKRERDWMVDMFVMGPKAKALPEDTPLDAESAEKYFRLTGEKNPAGGPEGRL